MPVSFLYARREKRLAAIAMAKAEIEKRAAERHACDMAVYEKKIADHAKKEQTTGTWENAVKRFTESIWLLAVSSSVC